MSEHRSEAEERSSNKNCDGVAFTVRRTVQK